MFENVSFITRTDTVTGQMSLPEGKRKVFISYKHSDEEKLPLCEKIAACILEEFDVAIWYDNQLTAGKEYDDEIKNAIEQSDAFVCLLTPDILSSEYVLEREIPFAKEKQVPILPVIAGIAREDIPKIEDLLGRVHMPVWFFGHKDRAPGFPKDSKEQFFNGLQNCIANKDLIDRAGLFYKKGSNNISLRHLTPEQMFIMAYGGLFGVGSAEDKDLGVKLMESILGMYERDLEFANLQEQVSFELIKHLYRVNMPKAYFRYLKDALERGYGKVYPLLFDTYRDQWHREMLCEETELSYVLFEKLYESNFGEKWDGEEIICRSEEIDVPFHPISITDMPRIGELELEGHRAFFQASEAED